MLGRSKSRKLIWIALAAVTTMKAGDAAQNKRFSKEWTCIYM